MTESPLSSVLVEDVTRTAGPTLVGSILNWYLYGVLTVQYVLYLLYSRKDKLMIQIIVHFIFVLDTVQTLFTMDDLFFRFVYGFGDFNKIFQFHWVFSVNSLDAMIALVVQLVYCWRIWILSGWRIIPIASGVIALMANVSGFVTGVQFQVRHNISGANSQVPLMLWLFGSAVVDVVVAGAMLFILLRAKNRTQRARATTRSRILSILILTLETNAITAAVAIETIIVVFVKPIAPPTTTFYEIGGYLLGKLYGNCFMILLNQRHRYTTISRAGSALGSRQQGSRTDNIELGTRASGTLVSSAPSKSKELPSGAAEQTSVSFGSFQVPGIEVKKAVVTM